MHITLVQLQCTFTYFFIIILTIDLCCLIKDINSICHNNQLFTGSHWTFLQVCNWTAEMISLGKNIHDKRKWASHVRYSSITVFGFIRRVLFKIWTTFGDPRPDSKKIWTNCQDMTSKIFFICFVWFLLGTRMAKVTRQDCNDV
jgi:hypothetical protein